MSNLITQPTVADDDDVMPDPDFIRVDLTTVTSPIPLPASAPRI